MKTLKLTASSLLNGAAGTSVEGHPVAGSIGTLRGTKLLDGRGGREWAVEGVVARSGVPYRSGCVLQRYISYESSEANGGSNCFHRIRPESVLLFDGDQTAVTGPVTKDRSRNSENDEVSQALVRLLAWLHAKYCKVEKIFRPGARSPAVMLRSFQVRCRELFSKWNDGDVWRRRC